jgi:hypothetical protein
MEDNDDLNTSADRASHAAFEYEISKETRDFLKGISESEIQKRPLRPLYIAGIAASLIILVISIVTINLSHNNASIASEFGINAIVARTGANVSNDAFREAVQSYYSKDYDQAKALLSTLPNDDERLGDFADWLSLLIELQTEGSKSSAFENSLSAILSNPDHEFHGQALEMQREVNLFWRVFVIKK